MVEDVLAVVLMLCVVFIFLRWLVCLLGAYPLPGTPAATGAQREQISEQPRNERGHHY